MENTTIINNKVEKNEKPNYKELFDKPKKKFWTEEEEKKMLNCIELKMSPTEILNKKIFLNRSFGCINSKKGQMVKVLYKNGIDTSQYNKSRDREVLDNEKTVAFIKLAKKYNNYQIYKSNIFYPMTMLQIRGKRQYLIKDGVDIPESSCERDGMYTKNEKDAINYAIDNGVKIKDIFELKLLKNRSYDAIKSIYNKTKNNKKETSK